jgi:hypothetical protein
MNSRPINKCLLIAILTATGLCVSGRIVAQDLELGTAPKTTTPVPIRNRQAFPSQPPVLYNDRPVGTLSVIGRAGPGPSAAIRAAAEAVRDAKDDDAKTAAQKKLTDLLSKYYDDDMVQRQKELKQIEERLAKLRELLNRRRTKKQEIIELQTKVALNEAEGLGFYDGGRPAKAPGSSLELHEPTPNWSDFNRQPQPQPQPQPAPGVPAAPQPTAPRDDDLFAPSR